MRQLSVRLLDRVGQKPFSGLSTFGGGTARFATFVPTSARDRHGDDANHKNQETLAFSNSLSRDEQLCLEVLLAFEQGQRLDHRNQGSASEAPEGRTPPGRLR